MSVYVSGLPQIDAKLKHLSRDGSKKAIVAGVRAGLTPIRRAMRSAINASSASPALKREVRKTIGSRFNKKIGRGQYGAKVGFAVGKKRASTAMRKNRSAASNVTSSGAAKGVGASANDIHWFVLGTVGRHTMSPSRYVGIIPAIFDGVTDKAIAASSGASLEAARQKIKQVLEREAKRRA